jgi:AcrR family transcriptional regulator
MLGFVRKLGFTDEVYLAGASSSIIHSSVPKIAKERTQENRRRIETAALEFFTTQGFHGTNNREIAEKVGVSTGTIYTYFSSKEAIFAALAGKYRLHMAKRLRQSVGHLKDPLSKAGIKRLARAIESAMYEDPEYFLLLLSDVIEFKNRHFFQVFHNVPQQFRHLMGPELEQAKKLPGWRGEDPAFVLASIYLYFFTFFLMERHMQGEQHLGLPNEQATDCFIDLLFHGLWRSAAEMDQAGLRNKAREHSGKQAELHHAERDRIEYLRFLSGRLWSLPPDAPLSESRNGAAHRAAKPSILFLPPMPRERIDENQLRIEAAALELFTTQGFHGTNIRDIAEKAGVSQGAIYLYYSSKEKIFAGLVQSYRHSMRMFLERVFKAVENPFTREGLRLFAAAMRSMVYDDAEYWLLMYIDVIEFKNKHFLTVFHHIPEQFRRLLGPAVNRIKRQRGWCGHDPALVMAMIYFYFHTYFVIERLMHGNRHLGVSDEEAVERFIHLLLHGLWSPQAIGHAGRSRLK